MTLAGVVLAGTITRNMKFGLFPTDPEPEKLQRGFAAGAVVSQTQYIF